MKISVIIITLNEEANIEECLNSVKWADEIIVIDSGSTDRTVEIALRFGCIIEYKEWKSYSDQKYYALSKAKNEWVLSIDADERISDELKSEILNLNESEIGGYYIRRENYFLDRVITTCGWGKDYQLRLFKKSKTKLSNRIVHEGFIVEGKTELLNKRMVHYTHMNLKATFEKINNYSSLQALERTNNSKPTIVQIVLHSLSAFFRPYVSLGGYKDGMYGFMIAVDNSITTLLTYMKIWELKSIKEKMDDKKVK